MNNTYYNNNVVYGNHELIMNNADNRIVVTSLWKWLLRRSFNINEKATLPILILLYFTLQENTKKIYNNINIYRYFFITWRKNIPFAWNSKVFLTTNISFLLSLFCPTVRQGPFFFLPFSPVLGKCEPLPRYAFWLKTLKKLHKNIFFLLELTWSFNFLKKVDIENA